MIRPWTLILVAVTLGMQSALAQTPDAPAETAPIAAKPEAAEEVTTEQAVRPATAQDAGAADDYRPSEQISDDLSVSFPIDI
jgi:hypothetical protein